MKITILGSSGQIGAYLSEYLRKKGHVVIHFDKVETPNHDMTVIPNQYLENAIEAADFVFFLAFDVGGSRYLKKYQHTFQFIDNNARLMANAFGLLKKYNKRFVFASSQMSNMSYSPYGVLKRVGELYTKSLNGLIIKFWNVYGVEKDFEKSHVITDFVFKAINTGVIDMLTDGQEEREFLYAEDCCEALEAIMNNYTQFTSEDDLHITSFNPIKIIEIANIIVKQFKSIGKEVTIIPSADMDSVQMDKKNKPNTYINKYWSSRTTIEEGISNIIKEMI